jgi:GxxExxY protein
MPRDVEEVGSHIVDVAVKLHIELGPGLGESAYGKLMMRKLADRGLLVERELTVPFEFRRERFDRGMRIDMLVEKQVIVELKSTTWVSPTAYRQVLTYLRLMDLRLGFLINFGCATLKQGLRRIVNNYQPTKSSPLDINRDS